MVWYGTTMQLGLSPQTWKVRAVSAGWDGMSLGFKEYEHDNDYINIEG